MKMSESILHISFIPASS